VQVGAPAEVYARPADAYTADFVGSANVIADGRIVRREAIEIGPSPQPSPKGEGASRSPSPLGEGAGRSPSPGEGASRSPSPLGEGRGGGLVRGVVEHVEFRGAVTGYRIRTALGVLHVDVWTAQQPRTYMRGEEVMLRLP